MMCYTSRTADREMILTYVEMYSTHFSEHKAHSHFEQ